MSTARLQNRRYTELAGRLGEGKPDPNEVGCWVVVLDRHIDVPLELSQVCEGPHHRHMDDETIGRYWRLHDGAWRSELDLPRIDLAGMLTEATGTLAAIRRGSRPMDHDATILRVHRAACLARRALASPLADRTVLESVVAVDFALADTERAWGEMVRTRIPNLIRAIAAAAALELARAGQSWSPNVNGRPHPAWTG